RIAGIPVRDSLRRAAGSLGQVAFAIRRIAVFSIAGGRVVMRGSFVASRWQRLAESAILRTLGASRAAVARIFAVEYACLGAAAGLGGGTLAAVPARSVARCGLEVPVAPCPPVRA